MLTRDALKDSPSGLTVIVDNEVARQNVAKLADSSGYAVSVSHKEDGIYLTLTQKESEVASCQAARSGAVIFIGSDIIGRGENLDLGALLMHSFLNTVGGMASLPESIVFMNNGVKLVAEGSPVMGELKQLEEKGVELLACGTCLSRLGLSDKIVVGQVSNMYTLASILLGADRVVSL
jgi:selenium metabolism protein YedF